MRKAASHALARTSYLGAGLIVISLFIFISLFAKVVFAWSTTQSAEAYCNQDLGCVHIKVTFKNTESQSNGQSMNVIATDEQTNVSVNLGTIAPQQTKIGYVTTDRMDLGAGRVRFDLTWTTGSGTDVRYASYGAVTSCMHMTPSPTATVAPTASPTMSPSPTVAPTASPTMSPSPTASPTGSPVATVAPTASPVPTAAPTNPPVRTDLTDGRSDGRRDSLDCVPESVAGRKSCNTAPQGTVLSATTQTLPTTGSNDAMSYVYALAAVLTILLGFSMWQYTHLESRNLDR